MNKFIVHAAIILSQIYLSIVALNAYYGHSPEAHFLVYKRFISSIDPLMKKECGNCTVKVDYPAYRIIGKSGQFLLPNFLRVAMMDIDSLDKALFFLQFVSILHILPLINLIFSLFE